MGHDSQMTLSNDFTIDATLTPADAPQVLEELRTWCREEQAGVLDIAPLNADSQLPTQLAIQLTIAALRELMNSGGKVERLTSRVQELCNRLGLAMLVEKNESEGRNG